MTDLHGLIQAWNRQGAALLGAEAAPGKPVPSAMNRDDGLWLVKGDLYRSFVIPGNVQGKKCLLHLFIATSEKGMIADVEHTRDAVAYVADIAHEIRNPLGSIELFASLLRKSLVNTSDMRRLDQIIAAVHVINDRITGLIDTMKRQTMRRDTVSLSKLLMNIIGDPQVWEAFLLCRFAPDDLVVAGDEQLLRHLFLTLFVDLLSGTPPDAQLEIHTGVMAEGARRFGSVSIGCFSPSGRIPPRDLAATLNLPVIHHIVQLHDGLVKVGTEAMIISIPVVTPWKQSESLL